MTFITKFNRNITYYSALVLLKAGLLCTPAVYGAEMTDEQLERQLTQQFKAFQGITIPNLTGSVCPAVQFIYDLIHHDDDPYLNRKLTLLLSKGAGVGGINNRQATDDERAIMFRGVIKAQQKGAQREDFVTGTARSDLIAQHQAYLGSVYDVLSEQIAEAPDVFDFVSNKSTYQTFNTYVKLHHAVTTDNWQELSKEVPNSAEFKQQAGRISENSSSNKQVQVMKALIAVDNQERKELIDQARRIGDYDFDREMQVIEILTSMNHRQRLKLGLTPNNTLSGSF